METLEKTITPEEYLKLSEESEEKLEYLNGEIIAMSGGTLEHTTIIYNLIAELSKCLERRDASLWAEILGCTQKAVTKLTSIQTFISIVEKNIVRIHLTAC